MYYWVLLLFKLLYTLVDVIELTNSDWNPISMKSRVFSISVQKFQIHLIPSWVFSDIVKMT